MNENEEMVYSSMGLDPILLLDEPPLSENYTVNIIRPGEEESWRKKKIKYLRKINKKLINSNQKIKKIIKI